MMNFLYISFFFPPMGGAESRYNLSLVRRLYTKGFLSTIITAPKDYSYPKDQHLEKLIPEGIKIKKISQFRDSNKYINKVRDLMRIPQNPLVFKGWKGIYKTAQAEAIKGNYRFIYSVHGIGATHLAALKLKKETGLPWIAEFQDPWFHNFIVQKYMKDKSWKWWYKYQLRKTKKLLRKVLNCVDLIVVESPMHGELLLKDFGIEKDKVVPYGMGYDEDYFSKNENCLINFIQKPVIGFVGSVYYGYEDVVKNFVLALKELEKKRYSFTFVSVGGASSLFSKYARETELKSFVPIDRVSLSKALTLMQKMNFGMVCVAKEYKSNINSKLWEYLKSNLSILAIVPEDGAMARIINEGKCGYILSYNTKEMLPMLEKALIDYKKGETLRASQKYVTQFSRENMVDKLVEKVKKILCKR